MIDLNTLKNYFIYVQDSWDSKILGINCRCNIIIIYLMNFAIFSRAFLAPVCKKKRRGSMVITNKCAV